MILKSFVGSQNPWDYLSRHVDEQGETQGSRLAENYVNFLSLNAVPKAMTLEEAQQATTRDKTVQCVVYLIRNQGWKDLNSLPDEHQEADLSELRQFKEFNMS